MAVIQNHPVPTGRVVSRYAVPGISCQATFIQSLRDEGRSAPIPDAACQAAKTVLASALGTGHFGVLPKYNPAQIKTTKTDFEQKVAKVAKVKAAADKSSNHARQ